MNNIFIDWNKLSNLPDSDKISFEKFCFHVASIMFGDYGTVSYFYNTPGSEFYIELNKNMEHDGVVYAAGDVLGWQAKFWRGNRDDANSPLGSDHRKELENGFTLTCGYKPQIKLWIICTPGCVVQNAWDTLLSDLNKINPNCKILSWHKDLFEDIYLREPQKFNGLFHYYFGSHFIGVNQVNDVSRDTIECLKAKYDVDLHTPSAFERDLLSIVDDEIANSKIKEKLTALKRRADKDKKKVVINHRHWAYPLLSDNFIKAYEEDFGKRYALVEELNKIIQDTHTIKESAPQIKELMRNYIVDRNSRVEILRAESKSIYLSNRDDHRSIGDYLDELASRVRELEEQITDKENNESLIYLLRLQSQKTFAVFAEPGHGKTHFACSIVENRLKRNLPVIFISGNRFRNCESCERYLCELMHQPPQATIENVLDALDFLADVHKCKLPIVIDGLNETAPNEARWHDELPPLIRKIRKRKHLLLITTCREKDEYVKAIFGKENFQQVEGHIHLLGISMVDIDNTVRKYFHKYDICPTNDVVPSAFSNPLLLKMFCLTNSGLKDFILNEYSLASCMRKYCEDLLDKISTKDGRPSRIARYKIVEGLNQIAQLIWKRNNRSISFYSEFATKFDETYVERLVDEGMCFIMDRNNEEEQVQFSYDMMAGYHIAKSMIDQCATEDEFVEYTTGCLDLLFGDNRHSLAEDVTKSLFFLTPAKFNKQWFEIMPTKDIILSAVEHMDSVICYDQGLEALKRLLCVDVDADLRVGILNILSKRVIDQSNISHLSLFVPLFAKLSISEWDLFWNSKFAHYDTLNDAYSLLHDRFSSGKFKLIDKIIYAVCMCGITDKEFRFKFHSILQQFIEYNIDLSINLLDTVILFSDPFIFESVVSVITGLGLRKSNEDTLDKCIAILESFLGTYSSNYIVLLDDLETLYSYRESRFGKEYDRRLLSKNQNEVWNCENDGETYYDFFDYDYDKYNIRPLYSGSYRFKTFFSSEEVYGMLFSKINAMGYDRGLYKELQDKEYNETRYRKSLKCTYSHKYGRHALMELYGWMILNGYIKSEYKNTFRTSIVDIDPSSPIISPMRTYNNTSFLPRDHSTLSAWLKRSNIEYMKYQHVTNLHKKAGEWVLLRGYFSQKVEQRIGSIYLSGTSQLVPNDMCDNDVAKLPLYDSIDYDHAFACELGWRILEENEGYEKDSDIPRLLAEYGFSGWDSDRFKYQKLYMLNPEITQSIGLTFNMIDMSYYMGDEVVSMYYVNESDNFFFMRKDVVDVILRTYDAKIRFHIYEQRIADEGLPELIAGVNDKFIQNKDSIFYPYSTDVK